MLAILPLIFNCCTPEAEGPDISFDQDAILVIYNESGIDSIPAYGWYYTIFPNGFEKTDHITINKKSVIPVPIQKPGKAYLSINDTSNIPLFLVPGDTLFLSISKNNSDNILDKITFTGKEQSINKYYLEKKKHFGKNLYKRRMYVQNPQYTLEEYKDSILAYIDIEMSYLNNYTREYELPEWFYNYENSEILYQISALIDIVYLRKDNLGIEETIPENYYDFLETVPLNNDNAIFSANYYYFLSTYFYSRHTPPEMLTLTVKERMENTLPDRFVLSDSLLSKDIADVVKLYLTSNYAINLGYAELTDKLLFSLDNSSFNKNYLAHLKNLRDAKFSLDGKKAPDFYLPDVNGKYCMLSNYKGKVVLLNFWSLGCIPCRKEIPFEKDILDNTSDEDFKLINICLHTDKITWKKALQKFNLEGVNLLAENNWNELLTESYMIGPIPHYTLIDRNGMVIKCKIRKPSEGLLEDILVAIED